MLFRSVNTFALLKARLMGNKEATAESVEVAIRDHEISLLVDAELNQSDKLIQE